MPNRYRTINGVANSIMVGMSGVGVMAAAAMKITSDALVKQGILAGDTFATVVGFSHAFRLDKKRPGLMVTLEER